MLAGTCENAGFLIRISVNLFKYLRFLIPILLIVLITFDLVKAFASPQMDDKVKKEATEKAAKRIIYAIIIFFVPTIVTFIFTKIESFSTAEHTTTTSTSWITCWLAEYNGTTTTKTNYSGLSTSTPRPATPTPVPKTCNSYIDKSDCESHNCYWYNNSCSSIKLNDADYGCCIMNETFDGYRFENNRIICKSHYLNPVNTKEDCESRKITVTPAPEEKVIYHDNRVSPYFTCSLEEVYHDTRAGIDKYLTTSLDSCTLPDFAKVVQYDATFMCESTVGGTYNFTINDTSIMEWSFGGAIYNDSLTLGGSTSVDIVTKKNGFVKVLAEFIPVDQATYQERYMEIYLEIEKDTN